MSKYHALAVRIRSAEDQQTLLDIADELDALAAAPPAALVALTPTEERAFEKFLDNAEQVLADAGLAAPPPAPAGETPKGKCPRCGSAAIRWNAPYVMCSACNCATVQRLETWLAVLRDKEQSDGDDAHALRAAIDALRAQPAPSEDTLRALAEDWRRAADDWRHNRGQQTRRLSGYEVLERCADALDAARMVEVK